MRDIKIDYIKIDRFKNLTNLNLDLSGRSASIYGKNGTGKTTVLDAINWVFTGQNKSQKTKFSALKIDGTGEIISSRNASVKVGLLVDGSPVEMGRTFSQKWTKRRGDAEKNLTGHVTKFSWNKAPVTKSIFEKNLAELGGINVFKILSDCTYFCAQLGTQKRRKILMDLISEIDVKKPDLLERMTFDEAKKMLLAERKEINFFLQTLPERIDELRKTLPDEKVDNSKIETEIKKIDDEIKTTSYKVDTRLKNDLKEINVKISAIEKTFQNDRGDRLKKESAALENLSKIHWKNKEAKNALETRLRADQNRINSLEERLSELKKEWLEVKERTFIPQTKCYACNQDIPEKDIDKQKITFETHREKDLERINEEGKKTNQSVKHLIQTVAGGKKDLESILNEMEQIDLSISLQRRKVESIYDETPPGEDQRKELIQKRNEIEERIKKERDSYEEKINALYNKKKDLLSMVKVDITDKIMDVIKERENEMKLYAVSFEELEKKIMELDDYSRQLSSVTEKMVNEKFENVKWKLFEKQVNGGVNEICEPTLNGVMYNQDLNNGAKIACGIECIKVLSSHYKYTMPILIDNAESITDWTKTDAQIIKTVVNEDYSALEIKME